MGGSRHRSDSLASEVVALGMVLHLHSATLAQAATESQLLSLQRLEEGIFIVALTCSGKGKAVWAVVMSQAVRRQWRVGRLPS